VVRKPAPVAPSTWIIRTQLWCTSRQRDVSFAAVSRAHFSKIKAFKKRMGWKFNWVSCHGTDFNYDYEASFTPEQVAEGRTDSDSTLF
jgi:predicted dithiol-disulfide oxidoreductase (DUF899 family)